MFFDGRCPFGSLQILLGFKNQAGDDTWKRFCDQFPLPLKERLNAQYGVWAAVAVLLGKSMVGCHGWRRLRKVAMGYVLLVVLPSGTSFASGCHELRHLRTVAMGYVICA